MSGFSDDSWEEFMETTVNGLYEFLEKKYVGEFETSFNGDTDFDVWDHYNGTFDIPVCLPNCSVLVHFEHAERIAFFDTTIFADEESLPLKIAYLIKRDDNLNKSAKFHYTFNDGELHLYDELPYSNNDIEAVKQVYDKIIEIHRFSKTHF